MSIINEALKKTGEYIQQNENKLNLPARIVSHPKPLLIYILILLLGIFFSKFIFSLLSQKPEGSGLASSSQSHKPEGNGLASSSQSHKPEGNARLPAGQAGLPVKTVAPPTPVALPPVSVSPLENNPAPEPSFVLNGIFFSDNDGYALVNNQIVRESDSVDGAKVTRITANTVELNNAGKLISLSTHR